MPRSPHSARFEALYREYYSLVLSTCERRTDDREAAEELAQDVFRVAWQRISEGTEVDLAWLYVTARNMVGNEYRRRERATALAEKASADLAASSQREYGAGDEVREAMSHLSDQDRELLAMAYWDELSGAEMAQILGVREGTIRVRLTRARAQLRALLDASGGDGDVRADG